MGEKAVVLLSGGLDSCTCMAVADAAGHELYPVSFDYHSRALVRKEDRRALSRGRASHHRDEYECCRRIGAD